MSSCEEQNPAENQATTHKLAFSFDKGSSMYKPTKGAASDVFDEFYAKLTTGELVAETYTLTFTEVESGAAYSFSGSWEGATVELQAATYKVTGTSTAVGEKSQAKCSIRFDETITVTNEMTDIVLNAYYDCYLFVMTSETLANVDNCFLFNNKYWYAFVNGTFVQTLTGSHKDGTKFSVEMNNYTFDKGKYYIYEDVSINEYSVFYLLPKMENGLVEWDGFRIRATSNNTVLVKRAENKNRFENGELFYSFDTHNWTLWDYESEINLDLNQIIYLKGNNAFCGETYRIIAKNGTAYASGYIASLIDNGTEYTTSTIPYKGFQGLFAGDDDNSDSGITGELKIPDVVTVIGTKELYGYTCFGSWWTSVVLPKELEFIGGTAFESNCMTEITIPKTVQYIGTAAFNNCINLSNVYFTGTVAEWSAIEKDDYRWYQGFPATKIICTDGEADF